MTPPFNPFNFRLSSLHRKTRAARSCPPSLSRFERLRGPPHHPCEGHYQLSRTVCRFLFLYFLFFRTARGPPHPGDVDSESLGVHRLPSRAETAPGSRFVVFTEKRYLLRAPPKNAFAHLAFFSRISDNTEKPWRRIFFHVFYREFTHARAGTFLSPLCFSQLTKLYFTFDRTHFGGNLKVCCYNNMLPVPEGV